jgi:hypothetical protein
LPCGEKERKYVRKKREEKGKKVKAGTTERGEG